MIHTAVVGGLVASLYQRFRLNVGGTINVLEAARLADIKRLTFTSSSTVYHAIRSEVPYKETIAIPLDGKHPIGNTKIACEVLGNLYADRYGLDLIVTRPSMGYGPHSASGFTPLELMVEGAVKEKRVVLPKVYPGENRDFIYIDDSARGIGMLHLARKLKHRVYNVSSGKSHTCGEAAELIKKLIPSCHIELKGQQAPWYPAGVDISRIRDELGFKPQYELEDGLRKYIDWVVREKTA